MYLRYRDGGRVLTIIKATAVFVDSMVGTIVLSCTRYMNFNHKHGSSSPGSQASLDGRRLHHPQSHTSAPSSRPLARHGDRDARFNRYAVIPPLGEPWSGWEGGERSVVRYERSPQRAQVERERDPVPSSLATYPPLPSILYPAPTYYHLAPPPPPPPALQTVSLSLPSYPTPAPVQVLQPTAVPYYPMPASPHLSYPTHHLLSYGTVLGLPYAMPLPGPSQLPGSRDPTTGVEHPHRYNYYFDHTLSAYRYIQGC